MMERGYKYKSHFQEITFSSILNKCEVAKYALRILKAAINILVAF